MFEDKKWSDNLKRTARALPKLKETHLLGLLIDMAVEEGRNEVLEDPKKFELGNCEDCDRHGRGEPSYNEGHD